MTILIGRSEKKAGQGFTLVELLLATVLLMLLLSAMIFSYSTLERGAALEEGTTQFEALLRYAQSQAATTGRKVQLVFEEPIAEDETMSFGKVRVMWEPDPLGAPGQWVELASARNFVQHIGELVQIQAVRPFDPGQPPPPPVTTTNQVSTAGSGETKVPDYQPPIVFYPDGSSDSAEVTLAAVDAEDKRRMTVRLIGITGAIQRRRPLDETEAALAETERQETNKGVSVRAVDSPASATAPADPK